MSAQLAGIERQVGRLMGAYERGIEDRAATAREHSEVLKRMDNFCEDIYERLRDVETLVRDAMADQAETRRMVADMKPAVDDFRRLRTMGSVAFVALGIVAAALGVKFSDTARAAFDALRSMLGK